MGALVVLNIRNRQDQLGWLPSGWGGVTGQASGTIGPVLGGSGSSSINVSGAATGQLTSRELSVQVIGTFITAAGLLGGPLAIYQSLGATEKIAAALRDKGWSITRVDETSSQPVVRTFTVIAKVQTQYSDATVTNNMRRDLAPVMNVNSVRIIRQGPAAYVDPGADSSHVNVPGATSGFTAFFDSLGLGLGISSPWAIGAGLLVLLLVIKKL